MWNVVNIRGTSGSGKSTIARKVLEAKGTERRVIERTIGDKKRYMGAWTGDTFFVGKYVTDCGGCDGLSWKGAADDICDVVFDQHLLGHVVLEGLLISSWGSGRLFDLSNRCKQKLHVLMLTTSLEECLASVQARREGAWKRKGLEGSPPPLNPENTTAKYHGSLKGAQTLEKMGVRVEYLDRDAALARALELVRR